MYKNKIQQRVSTLEKILIIGELLIDLISTNYAKELSEAKNFEKYFGGSPGNIALNLADMGLYPTIISRVGRDPFGKSILKNLQTRGVNVENIQLDPVNPTSFVLVSRSRETPQFFPFRGADQYLQFPENANDLIRNCNILHFSSWPISREPARTTTLKLIDMARKFNVKVCFDPNYRRILWENKQDGTFFVKSILKDVFLLKPSRDDALSILGKMKDEDYVRTFHKLGVRNVIMTLGKDGVVVSDGKEMKHFPSLAKHVVDTTGAGDAFWAGMYYSISKGKNVFEAAKVGSAVSAFRLENVGIDSPLPKIEDLLLQYNNKEIE